MKEVHLVCITTKDQEGLLPLAAFADHAKAVRFIEDPARLSAFRIFDCSAIVRSYGLSDVEPRDDKELQFARLLVAIREALPPEQFTSLIVDLTRSMNLTAGRILELFDRAEGAFEMAKESIR